MLHVNQFCSNLSHSSLLKDISCIESGRSFKISEDNKFKKMFQKYSLKQAILQLSKAITLIMTVLILQQKLSTRTVLCCLFFQNNVNWLNKSHELYPHKNSEQSKLSY